VLSTPPVTGVRHRWSIHYPLHSVEIRHSSNAFSWLKRGADEYEKFMRDLSRFLTKIDVVGLACVVDRPGYDMRYREKYGRRQWHLCQTAPAHAWELETTKAQTVV
jgi:hypothetical protein